MASGNDKPKKLTSREILSEVKDSLFTRNRWDRWVTVTTSVATLVIATATVIYTTTTKSMLLQIKRQADQTSSVIARMDTANSLYHASLARQDSNVALQRNYIKLQGDYYEKTVRPFVYAHSLKVSSVTLKVSEKPAVEAVDTPTYDSTLVIEYSIKNVGALPAKDIHANARFFSKPSDEFKTRSFKIADWKGGAAKYITGLFPEQNTVAVETETEVDKKALTVKSLRANRWVHILVVYRDFGDKEYVFKWIAEARISLKNTAFSYTTFNIWMDSS